MMFPSRDLAGSLSGCFLPIAGTCDERAGGPLRALVAFFFHAKTEPPGMITGGLALTAWGG